MTVQQVLPAPADVLLADGSLAVIRALTAADAAQLHALHESVGDDAIRLRFFAPSRHAAHQYVDHVLTDPQTIALVATVHGRLVGLGTAEPLDPARYEVAFLVADDVHGHGIGTLLLEHLAALAASRGITSFEADVLMDNTRMLSVFADAGFTVSREPDQGVVVVTLRTTPDEGAQARVDAREFRSEANSLAPALRPRSVAVVGARSDDTGIGAAVLRSVVAGGFTGAVLAIHPRATVLHGVPAFASLREVPGPVDLVVVCVPAERVQGVLEDAAAVGVPAVVVVSSGFGELGDRGRLLQHEMAVFARAHDMRLIGPNCLGLLCNAEEVRLNATFNETVPPAGGLAVASQSGGVGIVLMDLARELGLGIHTFVSLGNKADVSSNDLLAAWASDPDVTAAALYLESFGNPTKFARFARRFAEQKPLLAVVGGRSAGGSRAGASHTAAAATPSVGVDALFAQAGVIACRDAEDLARTALFLTEQPLPAGRRLAIVSNAGGMGVLAADAAAEVGLEVPEFSPDLSDRLADLVHGTAGTSNPVDAGAGVGPNELARMVDVVLESREADVVLVIPVATGVTDGSTTMAELDRVRADHPDLPVVVVPLGGLDGRSDAQPPITSYRTTASAVLAISRAARYAEWLAIQRGDAPLPDPRAVQALRRRAAELIVEHDAPCWLDLAEVTDVLGGYGLSPWGGVAESAEDAVRLADSVGYPVVVKVADPHIVHKTERGLVRVGLATADDVRGAVADFAVELDRPAPVLVQPMVDGLEVAVGVVRDPSLGPLVMVAAGGVATDLWNDRVFLVPPLSETDVARAVRSLRIWPLLEGFRGAPAADVDGLVELVVAVGRLAADLPELAELDLNPVLVGPDRCAVVDVKLRLAPVVGFDRSAPRQLRPLS